MKKEIVVFTDGACSGNPGVGGWAAIIISHNQVIELGGRVEDTTNNRMELAAVGKALRYLEATPCSVKIISDSRYVIDGITKWIKSWKQNHWKKADGKEILNLQYWKRLDELVEARKQPVYWQHVQGHSGHPANDRCDEIAVNFAKGRRISLYEGNLSTYPIEIQL